MVQIANGLSQFIQFNEILKLKTEVVRGSVSGTHIPIKYRFREVFWSEGKGVPFQMHLTINLGLMVHGV